MLLVVHHQFRHRLEAFEQQVDVGAFDAQRWLDAQHVAFGEGRQAVHAMPAFQVAANDRYQAPKALARDRVYRRSPLQRRNFRPSIRPRPSRLWNTSG